MFFASLRIPHLREAPEVLHHVEDMLDARFPLLFTRSMLVASRIVPALSNNRFVSSSDFTAANIYAAPIMCGAPKNALLVQPFPSLRKVATEPDTRVHAERQTRKRLSRLPRERVAPRPSPPAGRPLLMTRRNAFGSNRSWRSRLSLCVDGLKLQFCARRTIRALSEGKRIQPSHIAPSTLEIDPWACDQ